MSIRKVGAAALAAATAALLTASSAGAAVAGKNGDIAFVRGGACYFFPPVPACVVLGNGDLYVTHADGSGQRALTAHDALKDVTAPAWSPDGKEIVFGAQGGLFSIRPDGSGLHRILGGSSAYFDVSWSPDGSMLAYTNPSGSWSVFVARADGSGPRMVATNAMGAAWAPDCSALVYSGTTTSNLGLYSVSPAGGPSRRITDVALYDPDWSPNGSALVGQGFRDIAGVPQAELQLISPDGSNRRDLVQDGSWPAWAPDGSEIAYVDAVGDIKAIKPDGSGDRAVTLTAPTGYYDYWPTWQTLGHTQAPGTCPAPAKEPQARALKAGDRCSRKRERMYRRSGFTCVRTRHADRLKKR